MFLSFRVVHGAGGGVQLEAKRADCSLDPRAQSRQHLQEAQPGAPSCPGCRPCIWDLQNSPQKDPVQQACWGEVVQKRQGGDTAELIDKITCFSCAGGSGLRQPGGALTPCGRSARDSRREWPCYLLSDVLPICCSAITPLHADDVSI